jgi:hypothetical protein
MRATDRSAEELDAAIEELLVDSARPTSIETAELMATARLLHDELPRYHPRFGFEEHLARRLAGAGRGSAASTARASQETGGHAPGSGLVVLPASASAEGAALTRRRRGLLAGGAIASGVSLVIPLAGAALVAWRRGRTASGGL